MIYPIVKYGQKVLEKPAEPVSEFDSDLEKLVADMFETMYAASGVGLAAPQIGVALRVVIFGVARNPRYPRACRPRYSNYRDDF